MGLILHPKQFKTNPGKSLRFWIARHQEEKSRYEGHGLFHAVIKSLEKL
jgi:hypothetical protein